MKLYKMPTTERCARISKIVAYSSIILLIIALLVVTILSVLPNYIDDTECSEFTYPPNEMSYAHYGDGTVEVSWNIDPIDVRCGVAYNLTFIYEGTYFMELLYRLQFCETRRTIRMFNFDSAHLVW